MTIPLWLWIIIGIGFVGTGGYLVFYLLSDEEEDDEASAGYDGGSTMLDGGRADTLGETLLSTADESRGARKSRMLALKDSLERSLEGREGEGAETTDRMSMPWFLLLGASGSGKTTMLANTGLPLPYGPAFEVDSRKRDAGRWWLFHDAVVLEAPAASAAIAASDSTLPPGQTLASDTSEGWSTLLHMLRRERPDAPLNGIVVTVSCADLVAGGRDSERLAETADRIRTFLERTRSVLEVRLPLHILVTKCDVLAGFRSFAENLPAERRNDIFGWANPNPIETPFNPSWVDIGCEALKKELEDLRDEVLAAPDEITDADGLFVFVNEFGNLQEPLRDFVSRLYTEGEKRPPLFFRGMYFCGDAMDPELHKSIVDEAAASGKSRATMQLSAEVALTGTTKNHNLVFLRSLFTEKIFKEAGLAKPVARFRLSRDRRVVVAQAAAAIIAIVGSTGLYTTVNGVQRGDSAASPGLRAQADALAHALAGMAIDLDDMKRGSTDPDSLEARRTRDAAVVELVEEMRTLHAIKRSPFIPASWFDALPTEVRVSMKSGVQDIVLPVMRERLEERVCALLDTADLEATTSPDAVMSNPRLLADYLNDVRTLSRHVNEYNRLAKQGTGSVADLVGLLDYLFGMQFDLAGTGAVSEDFKTVLQDAAAPPVTLPPQLNATIIGRAMRLVSTLGEQAGRQLAKPVDAKAERAIKPEDDLNALRQLGTLIELSDAHRGIVASVSDSLILGANVARQVQDSVSAQVRRAAIRISGDSGAADLQAIRLRNAIDTLFSLRLMDPVEEKEIVADYAPTERLRWDVGRLELALSLRDEYRRAVSTVKEAMPGQPRERLQRALDGQLRGRILAVAANAQRLTPILPGTVPSIDVKYGAENLEQASTRLAKLAAVMDSLKLGDNGKRLIASATRQAEQVVVTAQEILDNDNTLLPMPEKAASWAGVIPLSWAVLNAPDSLRFETARLPFEGLVRTLTSGVTPALVFLNKQGADARVQSLVTDWITLTGNVQKYDKGDSNSTAMQLRRFLSGEMSVREVPLCVAAAAAPEPATRGPADAFVLRRRQFRAAMVARCGAGGAEAARAYEKLRALFNTRIAGRYPFVDSTLTQAPEVDPVMLRDFLAQYDAFMATGEVSLRADPRLAAMTPQALAFLAAMKPVRAFLAPLVDDDRRPLSYLVLSSPGDSVVSAPRELTVGTNTVPLDDAAHDLVWHLGDVVRVTERDSARVRTVHASSAVWSVFLLAKQPGTRFFHPVRRSELLPPSRFPTVAPEIGVPRAGANQGIVPPAQPAVPIVSPPATPATKVAPAPASSAAAAKTRSKAAAPPAKKPSGVKKGATTKTSGKPAKGSTKTGSKRSAKTPPKAKVPPA